MYKNVESEGLVLAHLFIKLPKISVSLSISIYKIEIAIELIGLSEAYTISGWDCLNRKALSKCEFLLYTEPRELPHCPNEMTAA